MNAFFYHKYWDIIGEDVSCTVLVILNDHAIPPTMNRNLCCTDPEEVKPSNNVKFSVH